MLQIAVCDDEREMREYLRELICRDLEAEVSLFSGGTELLEARKEFDLLLLDIRLDHSPDGMETARMFRKKSGAVIIFVTALKEYVFDAYDVEAFHYLLKPIDEKKFEDVVKKAAAKIEGDRKQKPLEIRVNGLVRYVEPEDIIYAENDKRKIILHTKAGNYTFYEKMGALEQKLGKHFFRSHRGYLVHLKEVAGYDHSTIQLKNGESVFLAKQKYSDFTAAYMRYLM